MKPSSIEIEPTTLDDRKDILARLSFRAIADADRGFLFQVYSSTREPELALVDWPPEMKAAFLDMQFNAQHTYYQQQFQQASFDVIELDGKPIGRLYLDRRPTEIRIIDISLMPDFRNRGIGTALLKDVLAEGRAKQQPVRIHVEYNNPALNLYRRLGFVQLGEDSVYFLMEWTP